MTHIVGLIEGYYEHLDNFVKFFHGRTYANGKAKVRVRVVLPVHFGINECGKEEFLADLKSFTSLYGSHHSGGGKMKKLFLFWGRILSKMFPRMRPLNKQLEKVECNNLRNIEAKKGNHLLMGFYPIGEILDGRYPDGSEIV